MANELAGRHAEKGPVVFEIPLNDSDRIDVLVVWHEFPEIRSEDRTSLILEAYQNRPDNIADALGVTYDEAMDQHLLPYAVVPMTRRGEGDKQQERKAMLQEGGIALPQGKVDLRFPTMAMAETARRHLCDRLPQGYWSISQSVAEVS